LYQEEVESFYALAAQLKIASYINLGRKLADWRRWIATKGPILARLDCDNTWMNAKETGGKLDLYDPMSAGGHAVALVGYDANTFVVRNSHRALGGQGLRLRIECLCRRRLHRSLWCESGLSVPDLASG